MICDSWPDFEFPRLNSLLSLKSLKLSIDLWHFNNAKVVPILNNELCWLCSFFLYWFFPHIVHNPAKLQQVKKVKKSHSWICKKLDQTFSNFTNVFDFISCFLNYVVFDKIKWFCKWLCAFTKCFTQKFI